MDLVPATPGLFGDLGLRKKRTLPVSVPDQLIGYYYAIRLRRIISLIVE
jgi:hypothetical protein